MNVPQNNTLSVIALLGYLAATCVAALVGSYFTAQVTITEFYAALVSLPGPRRAGCSPLCGLCCMFA